VGGEADGAPRVVVSGDGTPIACWRRGDGPPLLLVHGSGEDHTRWRAIGRALADRFTVFTIDRRGHGQSGDGADHSLEAEADDVGAVLDLIATPAHVLGHSFGALCCLEAGVRGAAVQSLVLHEPCLPLEAGHTSGLTVRLQALLDAGDREAVVTAFFEEAVRVPSSRVRLLRSLPIFPALVASAHTLVRELRATERYQFDPRRVGGLDVPVLLLAGSALESPFLAGAMRQLQAALPGSRLQVLPAGQHLGLDAAPARVVAEVAGFLRATTKGAAPARPESATGT
jgi:pimeloyl-ACP methyl ester carboxylesterase